MTRHQIRSMAVVAVTAFTLAGCGESAPTSEGAAEAMPGMNRAQNAEQHAAVGTVNSVDRAAGMINISHEAVASAGWPAMTMSFKVADPGATAEIEPGQRVEFRFTTEGGGTVTAIERVQ